LSPLTEAARAKPAQTVDLPTPPFPAATATNFFIFGACEAPLMIGNGMKGTILNYQIKKYKISLKKRALIRINYFKIPELFFCLPNRFLSEFIKGIKKILDNRKSENFFTH
jgi:hypothetical protein